MFKVTSRYHNIETAVYKANDGRKIIYKQRRFLPQGNAMPALGQVRVQEHDRLDQISAKALGDPEQFWQICDTNNAMNPFDLVAKVGRTLAVPVPQFQKSGPNTMSLLGAFVPPSIRESD